jgi:hypothetical protein
VAEQKEFNRCVEVRFEADSVENKFKIFRNIQLIDEAAHEKRHKDTGQLLSR